MFQSVSQNVPQDVLNSNSIFIPCVFWAKSCFYFGEGVLLFLKCSHHVLKEFPQYVPNKCRFALSTCHKKKGAEPKQFPQWAIREFFFSVGANHQTSSSCAQRQAWDSALETRRDEREMAGGRVRDLLRILPVVAASSLHQFSRTTMSRRGMASLCASSQRFFSSASRVSSL